MEKTYLQQVGERVYDCRSRNFCSRTELAKRAEVSVHTVAKLERGEPEVNIEDAVKISKALGYSTEYILTGNCGMEEFLQMNKKVFELLDMPMESLTKITNAFWLTRPKLYR